MVEGLGWPQTESKVRRCTLGEESYGPFPSRSSLTWLDIVLVTTCFIQIQHYPKNQEKFHINKSWYSPSIIFAPLQKSILQPSQWEAAKAWFCPICNNGYQPENSLTWPDGEKQRGAAVWQRHNPSTLNTSTQMKAEKQAKKKIFFKKTIIHLITIPRVFF